MRSLDILDLPDFHSLLAKTKREFTNYDFRNQILCVIIMFGLPLCAGPAAIPERLDCLPSS